MKRQKVFCIGLGKTGTTSLKEALRMLGYRVMRLPLDWKGITDFDAALPGVSAAMFPELDRAYPHSKFILTVRDVDGWLKSIERDMRLKQGVDRERRSERERVMMVKYGRTTFEKDAFRAAFHRHEAKARKYFANRPDDLLVLNVTTSADWEPLCSFLGVAVPDSVFPDVNKAAVLDALLARLLYVTGDIDAVAKMSKYSRASLESLYARYDFDDFDLETPVILKDDRRINKLLKRACAYFGSPSEAAQALKLSEESIKEGQARHQQHAHAKLRPRRQLARMRRFLNVVGWVKGLSGRHVE